MKSLTPFLIIAVCVGMYFMYISPTVSEIKGLIAKKAEYQNVLERAQQLREKRDLILTEYNSIPEEEIAKLNKIIPDTYDSVLFVNDVNNLVSQYGLIIKSVKDLNSSSKDRGAVTETAPDPYKTNIVSINVTGTYENFTEFLSALETSLRLMDVRSLSIKSGLDTKTLAENYEFILEVGIYSLH